MNGVIPISNVVRINVSLTPSGIPSFNTNNIGLFISSPFLSNPNTDLYRVYVDADSVGNDIGFNSEAYQQAFTIFSQQLNLLAGGGVLIIIPIAAGAISAIAVADTGTGYIVGDSLNVIQSGGIGGAVTVTAIGMGGSITTISAPTNVGIGYSMAVGLPVTGGSGTGATVTISAVATETLQQAISRASNYIYFNGILSDNYGLSSTWQDLSNAIQSYGNKTLALPSATLADLTGIFLAIKNATNYFTRCLYRTTTALEARLYAAAYISQAMSTNYNGSNTTITMNLKQLATILPDPGMNQSLLAICATSGVDTYVNYGGSFPGVVSNGANKYMDEVTNLVWLVSALEVAGFNALAISGTKIPQTEDGVSVLKGAYRLVLNQAVQNEYLAPGTWTSAYTFGNQEDFLSNIVQYGFYIYSAPVASQLPSDRALRKAPLIQIACKQAGAIQSTAVIVNINQ